MENHSIHIRLATVDDVDVLAKVGNRTWISACITEHLPEEPHWYTISTITRNKLLVQVSDPKNIFLIAEVNGKAVGFAQMRDGKILEGIPGPSPIEIERFYIQKSWRGKGVALHLILACLSYARTQGFQTIWLTSWKNNERARMFYQQWNSMEEGVYYLPLKNPCRRHTIAEPS